MGVPQPEFQILYVWGGVQELAFVTSARDAVGLGDTFLKNYYCGKIYTRYNLPSLTTFKRTIQRHEGHSQCWVAMTIMHFQNFFTLQTETLRH